jgi:hypothetical protein
MALSQIVRHLQEAEADHLQALALEAADDLTDKPALDAIGLDQDEGALQ